MRINDSLLKKEEDREKAAMERKLQMPVETAYSIVQNHTLDISSVNGNPMCNSATSVQSQQDEFTACLCHVERAVTGSHGLQAAFPVEETMVPQLKPTHWLVISPVTRGVRC